MTASILHETEHPTIFFFFNVCKRSGSSPFNTCGMKMLFSSFFMDQAATLKMNLNTNQGKPEVVHKIVTGEKCYHRETSQVYHLQISK